MRIAAIADGNVFLASPPRRHFGHEPDGRALKVPALVLFAVTETARLDLHGLDVLLVVAVVRHELGAAVGAVHFERALRAGLLVRAEPEVELLAPLLRSACRNGVLFQNIELAFPGFSGTG